MAKTTARKPAKAAGKAAAKPALLAGGNEEALKAFVRAAAPLNRSRAR